MFSKKKLITEDELPSSYTITIGKGHLGLLLDYYNHTFTVIQVLRDEIKNKINIGDILIKINNKNISKLNLNQLSKFCKKLHNKEKQVEFIHQY